MPRSTPKKNSAWPTIMLTNPPNVSAAWFCRDKSNRTSARPSARAAPRNIRLARPWCRVKELARHITDIEGSRLKLENELFMRKHRTLNIELPTPNSGSKFDVRCWIFDVYSPDHYLHSQCRFFH